MDYYIRLDFSHYSILSSKNMIIIKLSSFSKIIITLKYFMESIVVEIVIS